MKSKKRKPLFIFMEISDDKLELSKLKEKRPNYNTDDYV